MEKELFITTFTKEVMSWFIYLFGVLHRFQHCAGHIMTGSWKGRGNQDIQFVRVLYYKLPTNGRQLPAFPLDAMLGTEPRPQRWEFCHSATVAPDYVLGCRGNQNRKISKYVGQLVCMFVCMYLC